MFKPVLEPLVLTKLRRSKWQGDLFFKWANPGLFFIYFWSFQVNNNILTTNKCEISPSSIQRWNSNPRPFKHELSPITTRPGLPTFCWIVSPSSFDHWIPSLSGRHGKLQSISSTSHSTDIPRSHNQNRFFEPYKTCRGFFKNGTSPASFRLFSVFSSKQCKFYKK